MDIPSDSKTTDHRTNVWTTQNKSPINSVPNASNTLDGPAVTKSHLDIQQKTQLKVIPTNSNRTNVGKEQSSVATLTRLEKIFSWRFVITMLLQTSLVVSMLIRHCLPMAIVCMVKPRRSLSSSNGSSGSSNRTGDDASGNGREFSRDKEQSLNVSSFSNNTMYKDSGFEFDWSSEVQGLVLTSIMFSIFMGPITVTVLKDRLGSKWAMSLASMLSTAMTFLSPAAARISPYCLVATRVLLGVSLGGVSAVIGDTVAWWAPEDERLTMIGIAFTGVNVGSLLSSFLSGYLCLVPLDNGWPFVFYTFGTVSLIWSICWHCLSSHKPEDHPYISEKEKQYILSHRVGMDAQDGKKQKTPYKKFLSSIPVLSYLILLTCFIWANQIVSTYLPRFFNKHMGFSIQETGLMTSLTHLFRMCGTLFWTSLGNKLMQIMGTNKSRKLCISVGLVIGGAAISVVGFFDETYKWLVVGVLLFSMVNSSVRFSSVAAVPLDMAPRYAGELSAVTTVIANCVAFSGPLMTASLTTNDTQGEWRNVWIIVGAVFVLGALIFLSFGKASLQPWAQGKQAEQPHIMSSLVALGRRFSVFVQTPPLTPVMDDVFVFSKTINKPAEDVAPQTQPASQSISIVGDRFVYENMELASAGVYQTSKITSNNGVNSSRQNDEIKENDTTE